YTGVDDFVLVFMLRVVFVLLQIVLRNFVFELINLGVKVIVRLPKGFEGGEQCRMRVLAALETIILVIFMIVIRIDGFDLLDGVGQRAAITFGCIFGLGDRWLH